MAMELVNKLPYDHPYRWDGTLFGGPKLWRPADLGAALALWLDAEDASTITLNGTDVSQWSDKSGNNHHAAISDASQQPAYSATAFNGKPAVVWPNISNPRRLNIPAFAAQSFFFAVRYGDGTQTGWIVGNQGLFGGIANTANATGANVGLVAGNANLDVWFNSNPFNSGRYNGGAQVTLGGALTTLPMPETILEASHPTAAQTPALAWQIGIDRNVATRGWSGSIAEVIATPSVLAEADRQKLEGYLAWKWGLEANLPGTHPYRYTPPTTNEPVWDADALDYIGRVQNADGQGLELNVRIAIDDFVKGCKADGIWDAIKASCIMAGARTLNGALQPLVGTAPTNFNFVSGDYNRKTGLVGDGSTKYLDSNRNNNADPQNSKHITVYVGAAPTNTSALIGAREGVSLENGSSQLIHVNASSSSFRINSLASATSFNGIGIGLAGVSRTGASAVNWRHSSSFTGTDNATSQTPFSVNMHVFQRSGTSGNVPTNARLPFYSIGENLNLAQLEARVSALMNDIGAAIP